MYSSVHDTLAMQSRYKCNSQNSMVTNAHNYGFYNILKPILIPCNTFRRKKFNLNLFSGTYTNLNALNVV